MTCGIFKLHRAHDVEYDVGQLDVHVRERLSQALRIARQGLEQHAVLRIQRALHAAEQSVGMSRCSAWQSSTSDLRLQTFFTSRAFTSSTVNPRDLTNLNTAIQYMQLDSMATVSTLRAVSKSARACKVDYKAGKLPHRWSSRLDGSA